MKNIFLVFKIFFLICMISSCTGSLTKHKNLTKVTYDTLSKNNNDCSLIHLFYTSGFEKNHLVINWNNSIIYNDTITTAPNGMALRSITIPKNNCLLIVSIDDASFKEQLSGDYCNLIFSKSNDSLFLEFTNNSPLYK
ncbi:MAG TPA: hypothetical protein PKK00_12270 [Bacteroidales bacterium]|nr:hypothetical protein [Bacteroidales bacterium]HPS17825.1 hypothetical protein [Bacteroidales bacterium]